MRTFYLIVSIVLILFAACGDSPSDDYSDSLVLGTNVGNNGRLTGVADSFVIPSDANEIHLYWALESSYDIGGGFMLAMLIEQKTDDTYIERDYIEYYQIDERDIYYMIESFIHTYGTGSFRATAIVGIRRVASKDYSIQIQ